ncbi:membrane alanyl aminopeptidase-like [Pectinophora gossypiella]|uniref:membrane alanyl aminopeptidase-like n=1 Tax=Pectinophora gossypiella TaxID=13191 RepID=UPI00214EFE9E|nr:membrane alanyl aminopeptidase-like [Pectinophora gossypiella]
MGLLFKLVFLPALLAIIKAEFPLDYEETYSRNDVRDSDSYRLPEDLDPIHFNVEITPYFEAETDKEAFTFDGIVTIWVKATKSDINVLTIQENVREIQEVTVTNELGVPVLLNEETPIERVREYHFLKIYLRDGVTLVNDETYIIKIVYIGNINETPLSRGIFRGSYKGDDGKIHWYAASHLQPVNSRQAFPCFDEPGFKSTFNITINRPPNFGPSYSNMRVAEEILMGDRVKEIFHTTPRMSAYLVTVHISEEFKVIADNNDEAASYRIIARPNAEGQGEYALEVGPPLTKWLSNYFQIDYYAMEKDLKNDQIAVPDWASGATENWGLVSYRELRLLNEDGETNAVDKMSIATITAHELAHKWFGNLITCRWWNNVWINEGFASYFEYFAMDGVDKSMELEDQFNIMYVHSALSTDSSANTRALQHAVNSPAEVTGHFSGISYSKGASLLLMMKHFVSENTFKKALNYFLVEKAYEHAHPEDLYSAFSKAVSEDNTIPSNLLIDAILKYWVDVPGYPILTVDVNMNSGLLKLTQERFFISGSASEIRQQWPIPLTFTTGENPNWENLTPSHVMIDNEMEIQSNPGHHWVIFNVKQKGIYRVNYDTHNWEMIAAALKENSSTIHHLNRAQIVDDVFALMRSQRITYDLGFQVLDFLKQETNYYVWYPAISGFSWLRNRFLHLPDSLEEFDKILYEFLDAVITEVGYDVPLTEEPLTRTLNRFYILNFACSIGHEGCINDAVAKFAARNTVSVNPNIRRHVFCKGIHEGGYEEWKSIYDRRIQSNNQADQVAMLRALGCTNDEQAVKEYLEMILSDDVKAQDRLNAFTFLFMGDRKNTHAALDFIKENIDDIRSAVVLQTWFNSLLSNLASYMDEEGLTAMEQWLQENQETIPEYSVGISAIQSARNSMQWGTDNVQIILDAARDSAAVILPTTLLLFTTLMTLFLK